MRIGVSTGRLGLDLVLCYAIYVFYSAIMSCHREESFVSGFVIETIFCVLLMLVRVFLSSFLCSDECKKNVPVALIDMHSCSLEAKIKMNLGIVDFFFPHR